MKRISRRHVLLDRGLAPLAAAAATLYVCLVSWGDDVPGNCCFTWQCPNGSSAQDCLGYACNRDTHLCSGTGGCNPNAWAEADCVPKGSGDE